MNDSRELPEAVRAAYSWSVGRCFRCHADGVETANLGTVGPLEHPVILQACEGCVLELEADRASAARRSGQPYVPGGIVTS